MLLYYVIFLILKKNICVKISFFRKIGTICEAEYDPEFWNTDDTMEGGDMNLDSDNASDESRHASKDVMAKVPSTTPEPSLVEKVP